MIHSGNIVGRPTLVYPGMPRLPRTLSDAATGRQSGVFGGFLCEECGR